MGEIIGGRQAKPIKRPPRPLCAVEMNKRRQRGCRLGALSLRVFQYAKLSVKKSGALVVINERRIIAANGLAALSDLNADVWHDDREPGAYEWWYFDAISRDGRETLVVIFLAGFLFSPSYNRAVAAHHHRRRERSNARIQPRAADYPAIAICLYRDGRPVVRSFAEYARDDFAASRKHPYARIGRNSFNLISEADGKHSYEITLEQTIRGGRTLRAQLTWKITEGNFSQARDDHASPEANKVHEWNLVAPRCEVIGEYQIKDARDGRKIVAPTHFCGTGYHDHNRDKRWIPPTIAEWQWGRAHFPAATVVYYRFRERGQKRATTRLYLVADGQLTTYTAETQMGGWRRNIFGLRYPKQIVLRSSETKTLLYMTQRKALDSSFFYLRFASEAALETDDGRILTAQAITEHLAPQTLGWRPLWWLIQMRIGRGERAAFLP